jgi:large-conductance mechanosensitive channel
MSKFKQFITGEVLNLAVGYLAGLSASNLVSRYFVKKGLVNLWGVAAKREAVSKDAYEWIMLIASYLIGLIVMVAVSQLMERLRKPEVAD